MQFRNMAFADRDQNVRWSRPKKFASRHTDRDWQDFFFNQSDNTQSVKDRMAWADAQWAAKFNVEVVQ